MEEGYVNVGKTWDNEKNHSSEDVLEKVTQIERFLKNGNLRKSLDLLETLPEPEKMSAVIRIVPDLIEYLEIDESENVVMILKLFEMVAENGESGYVFNILPELISLLKNRESEIRIKASELILKLAKIGDIQKFKKFVPEMIESLKDSEYDVKINILRTFEILSTAIPLSRHFCDIANLLQFEETREVATEVLIKSINTAKPKELESCVSCLLKYSAKSELSLLKISKALSERRIRGIEKIVLRLMDFLEECDDRLLLETAMVLSRFAEGGYYRIIMKHSEILKRHYCTASTYQKEYILFVLKKAVPKYSFDESEIDKICESMRNDECSEEFYSYCLPRMALKIPIRSIDCIADIADKLLFHRNEEIGKNAVLFFKNLVKRSPRTVMKHLNSILKLAVHRDAEIKTNALIILKSLALKYPRKIKNRILYLDGFIMDLSKPVFSEEDKDLYGKYRTIGEFALDIKHILNKN